VGFRLFGGEGWGLWWCCWGGVGFGGGGVVGVLCGGEEQGGVLFCWGELWLCGAGGGGLAGGGFVCFGLWVGVVVVVVGGRGVDIATNPLFHTPLLLTEEKRKGKVRTMRRRKYGPGTAVGGGGIGKREGAEGWREG